MKILLSGFEPFGGETVNPSWEAVKRVSPPAGCELVRLCLPVEFIAAAATLEEAFRREKPDALVAVGQAGGRSGVSLERVAVNLMDARIPDNGGFQPKDAVLFEGGENAYFSTLPLRKMEKALKEAALPAAVSNTAGLYVCNCVFYTAVRLAQEIPGMKAGFIHVPYLPEQAAGKDAPSMTLEEDIRALEIILGCLAEPGADRRGEYMRPRQK